MLMVFVFSVKENGPLSHLCRECIAHIYRRRNGSLRSVRKNDTLIRYVGTHIVTAELQVGCAWYGYEVPGLILLHDSKVAMRRDRSEHMSVFN
jgi:hypothetical protein